MGRYVQGRYGHAFAVPWPGPFVPFRIVAFFVSHFELVDTVQSTVLAIHNARLGPDPV